MVPVRRLAEQDERRIATQRPPRFSLPYDIAQPEPLGFGRALLAAIAPTRPARRPDAQACRLDETAQPGSAVSRNSQPLVGTGEPRARLERAGGFDLDGGCQRSIPRFS